MAESDYRPSFYDTEGRYTSNLADFTSAGRPRPIRSARGGFRAPGFFSMGVDTTGNVVTPPNPVAEDEGGRRSAQAFLRSLYVGDGGESAGLPTGVPTRDAPPGQSFGSWALNAARGLTSPFSHAVTEIARAQAQHDLDQGLDTPASRVGKLAGMTPELGSPAVGGLVNPTEYGAYGAAPKGYSGPTDVGDWARADRIDREGGPTTSTETNGGSYDSSSHDAATGAGQQSNDPGNANPDTGGVDTGFGGGYGGDSVGGMGFEHRGGPVRRGEHPLTGRTVAGRREVVSKLLEGEYVIPPTAAKKYSPTQLAAVRAGTARILLAENGGQLRPVDRDRARKVTARRPHEPPKRRGVRVMRPVSAALTALHKVHAPRRV